ncbi:hypothetical protein D5045_00130 [Verminephrobacter eiseniae]|uniref:hypothetical protein n=1 Tax=Verminephrobacter eiseniae TaxID=364317 RepID=UPI0022370214|nr:hypothetical protein [Verminephrobacter eiseniae]MCW5258764.1 hypothetical protein [Verminephrobacter eiseniae]
MLIGHVLITFPFAFMNVASALYNFDMSLLLKGIGTTTLPTALFDYLRWDCDPTGAAVGSISIVVTLPTILRIDRTWGLRSLRSGQAKRQVPVVRPLGALPVQDSPLGNG